MQPSVLYFLMIQVVRRRVLMLKFSVVSVGGSCLSLFDGCRVSVVE